jgi:hypothetical protein
LGPRRAAIIFEDFLAACYVSRGPDVEPSSCRLDVRSSSTPKHLLALAQLPWLMRSNMSGTSMGGPHCMPSLHLRSMQQALVWTWCDNAQGGSPFDAILAPVLDVAGPCLDLFCLCTCVDAAKGRDRLPDKGRKIELEIER